MISPLKLSLILITTSLVAGCLGITKETDGLVDKETLVQYLSSSNRSVNGHPNLVGLSQHGTVRFDTTSSIPVYYVGNNVNSVPSVISESIEIMSNQLGIRFSKIEVLNENLTQYRDMRYPTQNRSNYSFNSHNFRGKHGIQGGIIFALDTSFYSHEYSFDPGSMCASASTAPYDGGVSIDVNNNNHTFDTNTLMWVNLGNGQCNWDRGIVLHEMAHALGLFHHFDYFGKWNTTSMAVLKLLYNNPPGTPFYAL